MFKKLLFRFLELSIGFIVPPAACLTPLFLAVYYFNLWLFLLYGITIPLMMMTYEFYEENLLDGLWFKIYNAIKNEPW